MTSTEWLRCRRYFQRMTAFMSAMAFTAFFAAIATDTSRLAQYGLLFGIAALCHVAGWAISADCYSSAAAREDRDLLPRLQDELNNLTARIVAEDEKRHLRNRRASRLSFALKDVSLDARAMFDEWWKEQS